MDSPVEYYYGDALRWSFGFENPNKAAVVFACLLPLSWMLWSLSWRIKHAGWRIPALFASFVLVAADAFFLFKTYSRGGAVAAGVGAIYLLARHPKTGSGRVFFVATGALVAVILGMFVWLGLGGRSLDAAGDDASVGNRLTLWRAGLQMAVENPRGFGTGNSGETYMQWYQALDDTEGYRTMVNSYLTFLVEQGWLVFALAFFTLVLFWFWAVPVTMGASEAEIAGGLRASILAFLVSGIFSTVMEEPALWVIPSICVVILLGWTISRQRRAERRVLMPAAVVTAIVCFLLAGLGLASKQSDPLGREFSKKGEQVKGIWRKVGGTDEWQVAGDPTVLGPSAGKLLRRWCLESGNTLRFDAKRPALAAMLVGASVAEGIEAAPERLVLLAPAALAKDQAQRIASLGRRTVIFLPEIDEDGRSAFWQSMEFDPAKVKIVELAGVGLQVDWAWDQVIENVSDL